MGSIVFNGHDFGRYCSAEVVANACVPGEVAGVAAPGRAGKMVTGVEPSVRVVRVRLRMLPECVHGGGFASTAREVAGWLAAEGPGVLVVCGEFECRGVVYTGCGSWSRVRGEESCEVEFICYDPVMYGRMVEACDYEFSFGGNWRTLPVVAVVAEAGDGVCVWHEESGRFVRHVRGFAGGEVAEVDCDAGKVFVDGVEDEACVDVESDFFWLSPGSNSFGLQGCDLKWVRFEEAWM